jgi:addiction module HigA family antidote
MPMKEPPHPGLSVRYDCLEPLGLTITEGAKVLGVSRQALNSVVNGKAGISPEMAIRLDKAFGGTADAWLALQSGYDLARVRKTADKIIVKPYVRPVSTTRLENVVGSTGYRGSTRSTADMQRAVERGVKARRDRGRY